jgi:hypothetical protein
MAEKKMAGMQTSPSTKHTKMLREPFLKSRKEREFVVAERNRLCGDAFSVRDLIKLR